TNKLSKFLGPVQLPVILFHAGFDFFSGGFVGVDVFFVISGYLITSILIRDFEQGKWSLVHFYERRARRILPMLFLVMLACLPFAWLCFTPSSMKSFAQSFVAVSVFSSNILFWREDGYFAAAAELKPLLHTWSLAVEEQYYLLFPLFLALFWRFGKRWVVGLLGLFLVMSLALAQWAAYAQPAAAFYLLPTRGWALLLGSLAAFYLSNTERKQWDPRVNEVGAALGLAFIFASIFLYSKTTPYPSFYTLLPTLGTVLVIVFATSHTRAAQWIGNKVFVGLGLISYSAYLWHQPLFAFARLMGAAASDKILFLALTCATLMLAFISWKWIEKPFRNPALVSRKLIGILSLVGSLFFIGLGFYGHKNNGDVGQISLEQKHFLTYFENDLPVWQYFTKTGISEKYRDDCNFFDIASYRAGRQTNRPVENIANSCFMKTNPNSKTVFIWGDSHAQMLNYGLKKTLPTSFDLLQVASSGCVVRLNSHKDKSNYCDYSNWFALDVIKKIKPDYVIVGQNEGHNIIQMLRLSRDLKAFGVGQVLFTGPSPHWQPNLPELLSRTLPAIPKSTFSGVDPAVLALDKRLKLEATQYSDIHYISLIDYFCNEIGCLVHYDSAVQESITTWDYGHLTPIASLHFANDVLTPVLANSVYP
ncbi:MAG: acyltransferase, partial [Neisseriaceae bacterium]|nr:acyltransferase [Neisseriaceae bacterium]